MHYYFAPMEGITDSIYRRLHHHFFAGPDRYYTPFFSPTIHRSLTPREIRELPPANAVDFSVTPQLMTRVPDDFLWMAEVCRDLGYTEVNLNVGCPSGTVTAKGKGAGMLQDPEGLDRFLDSISSASVLPISVKTRIGFTMPDEFLQILPIYNRYPICELIIHPRVRSAFYKGPVDMQIFRYALENSNVPVCYNGDILTRSQITTLTQTYPTLSSVMIGRGLIADPGLLTPQGTTSAVLEQFHDALLAEYTTQFGSARNAMFRMKENWHYWLCKFEDADKLAKQLRKATDLNEYKAVSKEIFHTLPMRSDLQPYWNE